MTMMTNRQPDLGGMKIPPIRFFVPGKPIAGGSKTAYVIPGTGRASVTEAAGQRNKDWRVMVAFHCREVFRLPALTGPLELSIEFRMPRPQNHYGTGRNKGVLKPTAPKYHTTRPDSVKLTRALEDALTHILWRDDSQNVILRVVKVYTNMNPGALVEVTPL